MNIQNSIILQIDDNKGRPLVILRTDAKLRCMYIFKRYVDMSENDKNIIRASYQIAIQCKIRKDDHQEIDDIRDIEDFLSFLENMPCG